MRKLLLFLFCYGLFSSAGVAKTIKPAKLKDGVNYIDINGNGRQDIVVIAQFDNNTSHVNRAMTIYMRKPDGGYSIVPVPNDSGFSWFDFSLSASVTQISSYRLYPVGKVYQVVRADKVIGGKYGDDAAERLPVKFIRYALVESHTIPGQPIYTWQELASWVSGKHYDDADQALAEISMLP